MGTRLDYKKFIMITVSVTDPQVLVTDKAVFVKTWSLALLFLSFFPITVLPMQVFECKDSD